MADDTNVEQQGGGEQQQPSIPIELQQQMAQSLAGFQKIDVPLQAENTEATQQQAASNTTEQKIEDKGTGSASDFFETLKSKWGYEKQEDVFTEIENARKIQDNPPKSEYKFENETSENIFKLLQKPDKIKEVTAILVQQEKLDSLTGSDITEENADEVIKLGMQIKYKDLTPTEINYKFNKQFSLPKEPIQGDTEDETDFANRKADWQSQVQDIKMNKIIEAKLSKPELEAAKSKLIFPKIENDVDEGYAQYQKMLADRAALDETVVNAYKAITPKALETKINFNDENNKIGFEFQYEPDANSFAKTIELTSDINKLFAFFNKPDGTPDRERYAKAIHFALNAESILMEAMKQTKNATIKAQLPDNNRGSGLNRQTPTNIELSDLDKMMQQSLSVSRTNGYQRV